MKHKPLASCQRGVTLISLLVGLVVAMIAVLAMLTLYRTAVQVTTQAEEYARITGDRSAAMVAANRVLQNIGFGVLNAQFDNSAVLQKCGSIALSSGSYQLSGCSSADPGYKPKILIWRYETFGIPTVPPTGWCEGLAIDTNGSLLYLRPQNCASLNITSWAGADVAKLFSSSALVSGVYHEFELSNDSCNPFGIDSVAAAHSISLIAHHPINDEPLTYDPSDDSSFIPFRMQTCLTNLSAP